MLLKKRFSASYIAYFFIVLTGIIMIIPVVFLFMDSFMSCDEVTNTYGILFNSSNVLKEYVVFKIIPDIVTLDQYYKAILRDTEYLTYFWNSVMYTVIIVAGSLTVSTLCGYGLGKFRFRGRKLLLYLYIIVMLLPYQVTLVPNFIVLQKMKLIGNPLSIILPSIFSTLGAFLMYQFIRKIPDDFLNQARIEGASEILVFKDIVLPQLKPAIASVAILSVIDCWSMVEQPLVLLQDTGFYPLSVGLANINQTDIGIAFAAGVIFIIPVVLICLLDEDYLVEGISYSVLK